MRTNKFNEEYIMLSIKEIDIIAYSIPGAYSDELRNAVHKLKKKIFEKITYENYPISEESEIAIKKNSSLGMIIINNLEELNEIINENMIKNAIIIAFNENNYDYTKRLVEIILEINNNFSITYSEFEKKYGQDLAYFVLSNGNLNKYKTKNNKNKHKDEHVFLYEDDNILEIDLPRNTKPYKL